MHTPDHPTYWMTQLRAIEWSHGQVVSLLELPGLAGKTKGSRRRLKALGQCGISTVEALLSISPDDLVERLTQVLDSTSDLKPLRERIEEWRARGSLLLDARMK